MTRRPKETKLMPSMQRVLWSAVLVCAALWAVGLKAQDIPNADAPNAALLENDKIEIEYVKPGEQHLVEVYETLKEKKVLERLKQFLSPLKLPVKLKITTHECGVTNAYWGGRSRGLSLCYEWFDFSKRVAPQETTPEGYTRDDAITGMFLQVTFHELGHGMFDIYDIPVLGREEDAADQMAGFIMAQFGPEVARRTLPAGAYVWQKLYESGGEWPRWLYSDEHGHSLQRSYNYLCMAYGADPETFGYYVDSGLLPKERAVNCKHEFEQLTNAFQKTMMPHIDPDKMKAVQATKWLPTVVGL
jgi:hypothetical protein